MLHHFRTLRFRLALLFLAIFGLILIGLSAFILHSMEVYLLQDFDRRLSEHADSMTAAIAERSLRPTDPDLPPTTRPRLRPYRIFGYYFQLVASDGTILESSQSLGELNLPIRKDVLAEVKNEGDKCETFHNEVTQALIGKSADMRVLTIYRKEAEIDPYYLQIAASLASVQDGIQTLRRLIMFVVPVGLACAAVAS